VYETAPWGKSNQPNYLNQGVQIETNFEPFELLNQCLIIEKQLGRMRDEKWGARLIDIDIIYFDNQIMNTKDLNLPHPRMAERKFVLKPLTEISPDFMHPLFKKTNLELLADCKDPLSIKLFSPGITS
jgi:2-amino-4-hydroxy-6-hydroxymethyldihydropteridine diphosphokinase